MSTVTSSLTPDPLNDSEYGPEITKINIHILFVSLAGLPVNLPQRASEFPLLPLNDLHNVEARGNSLKSSLNSSTAESGQHAGPEAPGTQLQIENTSKAC